MVLSNALRRSALFSDLTRSVSLRGSRPVAAGMQDYAAKTLAEMIVEARQQAIAEGVHALPAQVTRSLLGYFPEALIRKCRYGTGGDGKLALPALGLSYGSGCCMTLIDVVLFRTPRAALQASPETWARALTAIIQFQRLGVADLTRRYVRDPAAFDEEITGTVTRFLAWHDSVKPVRP